MEKFVLGPATPIKANAMAFSQVLVVKHLNN